MQEALLAAIADLSSEIETEEASLYDLRGEVIKWADTLPFDEGLVIRLRYAYGLMWNEIADCVSYSERQVYRIYENALDRL